MAVNEFDDNETLWAAELNALASASLPEAILDGCSISKGSGDWDTDVTSGTVLDETLRASVSAGTVTHTAPASDADLDAGESRVDLVTVDPSTDTLSITEGAAASNPASPDIPSGEVLLGFWHIEESDGTLADADRFDIPALFNPDAIEDIAALWSGGIAPGLGG